MHVDDQGMAAHVPLLLKPAWKSGGEKLGLVIDYALNPAFSSDAVNFKNLVITAKYAGPGAAVSRSRPTGIHFRDKSSFVWRLGDVTLGHEWQKITALFSGPEGAVQQPDHIEARWEVQRSIIGSGISISRLKVDKSSDDSDPFADESLAPTAGNWVDVETSRKVTNGVYEARQIT